jgi:HEAT repeat protein
MWMMAMLSFAAPPEGSATESQRALRVALDGSAKKKDRLLALDRLAASKDPDAVVPLAASLARVEGELDVAVRRTLASLDGVKVLSNDLKSKDPTIRRRAVEMFALWPEPAAFDAVARSLDDPDAKVRENAASALWRFHDARGVPQLIRLLKGDPEPDTRAAAAQALGKLGGKSAVDALEDASHTEKDAFVKVLIDKAVTEAKALAR